MGPMPGMGGPPPGGPGGPQAPPRGQNPVEANRSVMNPTDLATMASRGDIRQGMTVRNFIEDVLKVPIDAPVQALAQATQKQAQNADPMKKMGNIAQSGPGRPGAPPRPQGPPQAGPQGAPAGGLAALMGG